MGVTPGAQAIIDQKRKTIDQFILAPNIFLGDFPVDPWTPYLKTNNFVQQTISRMLGYDAASGKWWGIRADSSGYLRNRATIFDHEATDYTVFDAVSVPAAEVVTHDGIDVSGCPYVSFIISTTLACTVYVQGSSDNVNWHDLKSDADADLSWGCNNEKIWFRIPFYTHYVRLVVRNGGAVAATITGVIMTSM